MKHIASISATAALVALLWPGPAGAAVSGGEPLREAAPWAGRYIGILPRAGGPAVKRELTINEAGFYTLKEVSLGKKKAVSRSKGKFIWDTSGTRITLQGKNTRTYLVAEGRICPADAGGDGADSCLRRQDEFNGAGAQLFVDPESVRLTGGNKRPLVRFTAIMNFQFRTEEGCKSLAAAVEIDCAERTARLSKIACFFGRDAEGKRLKGRRDSGVYRLPAPDGDADVVAQAAERYCRTGGNSPWSIS